MANVKNTTQEIEEALIKHGGLVTYAARELKCNRETIRKRIKNNKKLQVVQSNIKEKRGDIAENILDANMRLAEYKANRILELLALADSDVSKHKELWRFGVDKDSMEQARKTLSTDTHKDRGYIESKTPIEANVIIPKVVMEIVRTSTNSGAEDTDNG